MADKTQILQLGLENWAPFLSEAQKEKLEWVYLDVGHLTLPQVQRVLQARKRGAFEGVLCTDTLSHEALRLLDAKIEAYSLILDTSFEAALDQELKQRKCPLFMDTQEKSKILKLLSTSFFGWQGGSTLHTPSLFVAPDFEGKVSTHGSSFLRLEGNFEAYAQKTLVSWQQNMGFLNGQSRKLFLNYSHEEGVEVFFDVAILAQGSSKVLERRSYDETALTEGIDIACEANFGSMSFSLRASGQGRLDIGILHIQDSRNGYGEYLLGGQRVMDHLHQDFYYYFHPGDLKPPLTVYFAGFHSGKSFEGFFRMKKTGAPFLLITDSRLTGGSFYMGSPELEGKLVGVIEQHLTQLGFSHHELILSGLSMGTTGALYYAKDLSPHTVLLGKPLANLGDVTQNERLTRPGGFLPSLDIQYSLMGSLSEAASQALNARFWDKFDQGNYEATTFMVAYMLHDDYDDQAYRQLQEHLVSKDTQLIGKGILGRHNDNTPAINAWFFGQHQRLLREEFGREEKNGL